jgi:dTDP-glucose 4,6-dehydratase
MILPIGREQGHWGDREIVTTPLRTRPGSSEVLALRVGYEKLNRETGWEPLVSWEEGIAQTIAWYAENRERWIGRVDWLSTGSPTVATRTP